LGPHPHPDAKFHANRCNRVALAGAKNVKIAPSVTEILTRNAADKESIVAYAAGAAKKKDVAIKHLRTRSTTLRQSYIAMASVGEWSRVIDTAVFIVADHGLKVGEAH